MQQLDILVLVTTDNYLSIQEYEYLSLLNTSKYLQKFAQVLPKIVCNLKNKEL